jgi:hypothetical protein
VLANNVLEQKGLLSWQVAEAMKQSGREEVAPFLAVTLALNPTRNQRGCERFEGTGDATAGWGKKFRASQLRKFLS